MRKFLFIIIMAISHMAFAQKNTLKTDQDLQRGLGQIVQDFKGDVGIYVQHLPSGKYAAINADTLFQTASIVKIPILVGLFDKIEKKELEYTQKVIYRDSMRSGGSGLMQYYKDSAGTDLSTLATLMITYSDNTTSLWCQHLAGGGETINTLMDSFGLTKTKVNSRTPGREKIREAYGWGQTTPFEIAQLMIKIRHGEVISPAASDRMYRIMTNIYYDDGAISQFPAQIQSASKQGMVNASRSEVIMVNAPHGDYVFSVMTQNNEDRSWQQDNDAWELIRQVSAYLWNYFEPDLPFTPIAATQATF